MAAFFGLSAGAEDVAGARKCPAISDPTARLACFDAAFHVASQPPEAMFGDNKVLEQKRAPKVAVPKTMDVTVTRAVKLANGLYRLTVDNGQVWETREASWSFTFKANDFIRILRLPLGDYQISLAGKRYSVAARRIQ